MPKIDSFTSKRASKYVTEFREKNAQLPTLRDLEAAGFSRELIDAMVKEKILNELYVTLTSGAVVKGYKLGTP